MHSRPLAAEVGPAINRLGAAWYFLPPTIEVGRSIGLDGFRFYFLGRGGVLGDVEWPVVLSAFGYFNPALLEKMWKTARQRCDVTTAVTAHMGCCHDYGRGRLHDVVELGPFCDAAQAIIEAAVIDPAALPLFAAYTMLPLAPDLPARAMQLVVTLRELRGSVHLVAVVASGLASPVAHWIRRPKDVELFGWKADEISEPTDEDRRRLDQADELTNTLLAPAFSTLDDAASAALIRGVDAIRNAVGDAVTS
jgi:hypothetical protein